MSFRPGRPPCYTLTPIGERLIVTKLTTLLVLFGVVKLALAGDLSSGSKFADVYEKFQNGTLPSVAELASKQFEGRCYERSQPNSDSVSSLGIQQLIQNGGPLFPKNLGYYVFGGSNGMNTVFKLKLDPIDIDSDSNCKYRAATPTSRYLYSKRDCHDTWYVSAPRLLSAESESSIPETYYYSNEIWLTKNGENYFAFTRANGVGGPYENAYVTEEVCYYFREIK